MMNWPLLLRSFILLLHLWAPMVQWVERSNVCHINGLAQQGCKHMSLEWDLSIIGCSKGNHGCSVFLHSYLWLQQFNWLSPSGLSLVWCCTAVFRDNCFLAVLTICDCFVARAVWELLIVGVPLQSSTSSWFSTCGWFESLRNLL